MTPAPGRWWRLGLLGAWALLVTRITLISTGRPRFGAGVAMTCLLCGTRGLADFILNVVLFVPLGWIAFIRLGWRRAVLAGLLLSLTIEIAQMYVPGRSTTLGDLVSNTLGAAVGATLLWLTRNWLGDEVKSAARATPVALGLTYLGLAGFLLQPLGTDARYFGQWTAYLGNLTHYKGELLSARINGADMPSGPWPEGASSPDVTTMLDVRATVVRDEPRTGLAPIVSIYDANQVEILMLGAAGEDLFFRQRTRATAAGLDYPEVRSWGVLQEVAVGDTMTVAAWRDGRELCLAVRSAHSSNDAGRGGDAWERRDCRLGLTPGRTWMLLMNPESASRWFRQQLDRAWMATLFVLTGVAFGGGRPARAAGRLAGVGLVSAGVVALVAASTPLVMPAVDEWAGLAAGLLAGAAARPLLRVLAGIRR